MIYHIIYNPVAGHGLSQKNWTLIREFLKTIDFAYELHETKSEGHAETITRFLTSKTNQMTIICLGGDGTLSEIVNGIDRFDNVSLACVPCGSGNDFVLATKIPLNDPIAAMKFIITNSARPINFININGKRCINVCGFGLDTEVLKFYYKMKFLPNKMRYTIATIVKTLFFKWHESEVRVDGGPWTKLTTLMLTIGNGMAIGGGIKMCPLAKIDDDYLDFTCINKFPRIKVMPALKAAMDGKVLKLRFVKSVKCKTIEIKIPNKTYQRDGIIVQGESEMNISIAKEKINFIG